MPPVLQLHPVEDIVAGERQPFTPGAFPLQSDESGHENSSCSYPSLVHHALPPLTTPLQLVTRPYP